MVKILLSLPDDVLREIDDYRNKKGMKRNKFFLKALDSYFMVLKSGEYFDKRKDAVNRIKETSEKIMKAGIKNWDPVKELRKSRDERADELLSRWEKD